MRRRLVAAAVVAIALVGGIARAEAAQTYLRADEIASLQLLNGERAVRGLSRLKENAALATIARDQAVRMAVRGEIYHNPRLGEEADAAGVKWMRLGENVGVGPTAGVLHKAFLASPRHRDNMLYPSYTAVGVGIVPGTGTRKGTMFVAHVFGRLIGASRPTPVVSPATARPQLRPGTPRSAPSATPAPTPRPRPPAPSPVPNAVIGGVVDHSALVGVALPR